MASKIVTSVLLFICICSFILVAVVIHIGANSDHTVLGSELTHLRDSITISEYQKGIADSIASRNADSIYLTKVRYYTND